MGNKRGSVLVHVLITSIVVVMIGHGDEVLLLVDEPRRLAMTEALGHERQVHADRSNSRGRPFTITRWTLVGRHSGHDASVALPINWSENAKNR